MCSQYWTLLVKVVCPECKKKAMWDLQTHFMGEMGSCANEYKIGEQIKELVDVTIILDGENDSFSGACPSCYANYDFGAEIEKGKIKKVFVLKREPRSSQSELLKLAHAAAGSGKNLPRPWGTTSESIAEWVHNTRQEEVGKLDELDKLRESKPQS